MDPQRFDTLVKALSTSSTRRRLHDPSGAPDRAAPLGRAGLVRACDVKGERQAAVIAGRAGDLLRSRHRLGDQILGERGNHGSLTGTRCQVRCEPSLETTRVHCLGL
jgi:hypothetical protein